MIIKKNLNFSQFVWQFNHALDLGRCNFRVRQFTGLIEILDELYKDGFIVGYKKNFENIFIEIFLKIDSNGSHLVKKIENLSKASRIISGRVKELKADVQTRPHVLLFIRTARLGLISSKLAIKHKLGGTVLGKIQ